ncbi:MAG TPA: helix-turn-helix domain-containing protein [Thermomicrobiales bacterium]|nr:helix-turn-helix domain-containing protein [Thermomicrobiales bacterium]
MATQLSAWVSPAEAATILGISRNAVYSRIETGLIPASALAPRSRKGMILISRNWLTGTTPANVVPFERPALSSSQLAELADQVSDLVVAKLARLALVDRVG